MLTLKHALQSAGVLVLLLSVISPSALASDCNMLSSNVDDARTRLKRATNETDFESAKNYARRVRSALEDAAMSAMDCKCNAAYNETVVKPPGLSSPCTMKGGEGLLTTFGVGFTPHI